MADLSSDTYPHSDALNGICGSTTCRQSDLAGKPTYCFGGDLPVALAHLRQKSLWVAWDYRPKGGKWTKPPIDPRTGRMASVSDPATWVTFDVALAGMETHGLAGIGLVLTEDGGVTGVDLDDCLSDSGRLSDLAAEVVGYSETYAEVSPSGEGIRLFALGKVERALKDDALGIEVYSTGRYLTVTGNRVEEAPDEIREAPHTLARLVAEVAAAREHKLQKGKSNGVVHAAGADCFANVNAAALARLDNWVPALHPTARKQPNGAWRIPSKALGRNLEEDLSYYPTGIRDHGEEHGLSAIDAVLKYGTANDARDAAFWLCQQMGVEPAAMGWKAAGKERAEKRNQDRPRPNKAADTNEPDPESPPIPVYRMTEDGIQWCRQTRDGPVWTSLTNFKARVISDIALDDGIETTRTLEIEATINHRPHKFAVAAQQFPQMTWPLEHLGAEAVVEPGQGSKDRARAAIQILSGSIPQRCVYTHTGWRQVDGQWVYMHGGGALGPVGPVGGLEVQLPEQLDRYVLPSANHDLRDAVKASLATRNVAPDRVTIPLLGAVYRAPIGGADFSLHLSGHTGGQKSELAALAQQHFGAEMDGRALPASWSSTGNALEAIASTAKDTVLVIDDYVPQGTTADRQRLNGVADRVLRAQGNRSGRGRLRSDATMRRTRPPRGLIISTGEEVPGGQSLRARIVVIGVQPGQVNLDLLTLAQQAAAQGSYARAMAGFIQWVASQLDQVRDDLIAITRERRTQAGVAHARTADALAQLFGAWTIWLRFVVENGVVTRSEADEIEREVWSTLTALGAEQQALQRDYDPVDRFYSLLGAVLSSGKGHIALASSPDRRPDNADDAKALGWRRHDDGAWHCQGPCIGWWAEDGIYLEPDASYAAAQQLGSSSGEGVGVSSTTLHRRMHERRLLLSTELRGGETRLKARKSIGGRRLHVIHIAHTLSPHVAPSGPTGPSGQGDENDQPHQELP